MGGFSLKIITAIIMLLSGSIYAATSADYLVPTTGPNSGQVTLPTTTPNTPYLLDSGMQNYFSNSTGNPLSYEGGNRPATGYIETTSGRKCPSGWTIYPQISIYKIQAGQGMNAIANSDPTLGQRVQGFGGLCIGNFGWDTGGSNYHFPIYSSTLDNNGTFTGEGNVGINWNVYCYPPGSQLPTNWDEFCYQPTATFGSEAFIRDSGTINPAGPSNQWSGFSYFNTNWKCPTRYVPIVTVTPSGTSGAIAPNVFKACARYGQENASNYTVGYIAYSVINGSAEALGVKSVNWTLTCYPSTNSPNGYNYTHSINWSSVPRPDVYLWISTGIPPGQSAPYGSCSGSNHVFRNCQHVVPDPPGQNRCECWAVLPSQSQTVNGVWEFDTSCTYP